MANRELKIVLINPPSLCVEDDRLEPHLGLLYLAAELRRCGFDGLTFVDLSGRSDEASIDVVVDEIPPADLYGVTSFSTNWHITRRLIEQLDCRYPQATVLVGGAHATALPELVLAESPADAVIVGEGETMLTELALARDQGWAIQGIYNQLCHRDLDDYPFPARDLVDYTSYSRRLLGKPVISILGSRGCKHRCLHCNSVVMRGRQAVQFRSATNICDEITSLRDRCSSFRFNDDNFSANPQIEPLLEQLEQLDIDFRIFARVDDLTPRLCRLLHKAGCVHVTAGLESLNPQNLKLLGRASQIGCEANVTMARKCGLTVRASFIVGLPFDTDQSVVHSFEQAAAAAPNEFAIYPLIPYPGTPIHRYPERFGYTIVHEDFSRYVQMGKGGSACLALEHENFSCDDVRRWMTIGEDILIAAGSRHMRDSQVAN